MTASHFTERTPTEQFFQALVDLKSPDFVQQIQAQSFRLVKSRRHGEMPHKEWLPFRETPELARPPRVIVEQQQLRRNLEIYEGAVIADSVAVDLLDAISNTSILELEGLGSLVGSPREAVALGKLFRANYVTELDTGVSATALGKEEIRKWRDLLRASH